MKILGINDQHNASAALIEDGVVTAAVQEERLSRIKNHFCFPHGSIRWVLDYTGTRPEDVDAVAIATHEITAPFHREQLLAHYERLHSPKTQIRRLLKETPAMNYVQRKRREERLTEAREAGFPVERVTFVDHHTAHAAAAYHGSPWKQEKVLVLTVDGEGDGLSASARIGQGGNLSAPIAEISSKDSLGAIYSMITFIMGMVPLEHEYKLMGLAPYAPESGAERSYEAFKDVLRFEEPQGLGWRRNRGVPDLFYSYRYFRERLRNHRFDWIAAGLQRFTEEHLVEWVRRAIRQTDIRLVALGGGVFMNVKANQLIYEMPEVDELFIFPSCGDETNSMGAAWQLYAEHLQRTGSDRRVPAIKDVYWCPPIDEAEIEKLLPALRAEGYQVERHDDIEQVVADLLVDGQVVARAKGRAAFGARALGNRSILADPTRKDVVRIINDMIKNRDFWMPFAPSMLAEESDDYVVNPKKMDAPYMIITFDTTERAEDFPAGIQPYDRTARPQFVHRERNADYHRLIERFFERTGRAVLLNTSFNLHGHPIVNSAADAVSVLRNSGLRHLALNNWLITKQDGAATSS